MKNGSSHDSSVSSFSGNWFRGVRLRRVGRNHTELTVTRGGSPIRQVRYRNLTPDLDLGLVIRDVLDNTMRRSQFFTG